MGDQQINPLKHEGPELCLIAPFCVRGRLNDHTREKPTEGSEGRRCAINPRHLPPGCGAGRDGAKPAAAGASWASFEPVSPCVLMPCVPSQGWHCGPWRSAPLAWPELPQPWARRVVCLNPAPSRQAVITAITPRYALWELFRPRGQRC